MTSKVMKIEVTEQMYNQQKMTSFKEYITYWYFVCFSLEKQTGNFFEPFFSRFGTVELTRFRL